MPLIKPPSLSTLVAPLVDFVDYPNGLFRVYYTMRDVFNGRSDERMGVFSRDLVLRYAHALEQTARKFLEWGWDAPLRWPQHGDRVPVYVFDTSQWVRAHAPFTQTNLWGYSLIGLRSDIPEPRYDVMWERADVEAVHEATHVFTHRNRRPEPRFWGGVTRKDRWYWLDEGTAVFMEAQMFRGHKEPMRFATNFVYRPDLSLVDDGPGGGYFAAWFVRCLVLKHGHEILRDAWKQATPLDADPIAVIDQALRRRNHSFDAAFTEYCVDSASMCDFDFDVFTRHGNRSITESFRLSHVNAPVQSSEVDWLEPLACRYYRVEWDRAQGRSIEVAVKWESATAIDGVKAVLIPYCEDGFARRKLNLEMQPDRSELRRVVDLKADETRALLVVARGTALDDEAIGFRIECSAR
ncbi:hypothetical protein [Singulisphaera acidiphila]|uniref:Uncharacterized protein n=1 Tax=Singulisphaera acidiphila (strain ATCC BAA-1392 / DSM 18658 / VKM B-2454 / MOB10) TaxID=886293 RepID=L0DQX6_SINAD|nr:hypothetical protein [Singulisphaera acidiphila]AGA31395.1 hypothetical protein Sinac_7356 [Singulisphaera acidiphila DSM 18658]